MEWVEDGWSNNGRRGGDRGRKGKGSTFIHVKVPSNFPALVAPMAREFDRGLGLSGVVLFNVTGCSRNSRTDHVTIVILVLQRGVWGTMVLTILS